MTATATRLRNRKSIGLAAALALLAPGAATAAPQLIDNFDDWSAFADTQGGEKVCYVASLPKKAEGDYTSRGDTYVMVTHRPQSKEIGVVHVEAGYAYKEGSQVKVSSDGPAETLFTSGGTAWAYDAKGDRALVALMKAGASMVVRGTSSRGTLTTDTYSLKGFTKAYGAIGKACGLGG